jgi:hypothetical protein
VRARRAGAAYPRKDHGRSRPAASSPTSAPARTMTPSGSSPAGAEWVTWRLRRSTRSRCSTASISLAHGRRSRPRAARHASAKSRKSRRRQYAHGRCPAASAVASSRKNSAVHRPGGIGSRRMPLHSRTQQIHARDRHRLTPSSRPCPCRQPRLPIIRPRLSSATISPVGITRFCSGTVPILGDRPSRVVTGLSPAMVLNLGSGPGGPGSYRR